MAKVSIVMPMYNQEPYIRECLESVINQTLKDIEIIVVNDGSKDNSLSIVKEYANTDSRIKIIDKPNSGYGNSMNEGLKIATGEYIGIVETDDFVKPNMFKKLYQAAIKIDADLVKSNFLRFYDTEQGREFSEVRLTGSLEWYNRKINPQEEKSSVRLTMNIWTGIYKTAFLRENGIWFNETPGASFQDNGFHFLTFYHATKAYFLDEPFYCVRRDNPNSSVKDTGKAFIICEEYDHIYNQMAKSPEKFKEFLPYYSLRKYQSYYFNYTRISEDLRLSFIEKFYNDFIELKEKNALDLSLFDPKSRERLEKLLNNPYYYYATNREKNNLVDLSKERAKVSVIIPVYNKEDYIKVCLDSVINQTLKEIEVICINDGSKDNSIDILVEYAKSDYRIKVIDKPNEGVGAARNDGLKRANSEFVIFMDPDDWYPDLDILATLYDTAIEKGVLVCGGSFSEDKDGVVHTEYNGFNKGYAFEKDGYIEYKDYQFDYGYHRFIFNLKMLKDNEIYFPLYSRFQDPPFFVRAMVKAVKFYAISKIVYRYRWGHQNINWTTTKICDLLKGLIDLLKMSRENEYAELHLRSLLRIELDFADRIVDAINADGKPIVVLLAKAEKLFDMALIRQLRPDFSQNYTSKTLSRARVKFSDMLVDEDEDDVVFRIPQGQALYSIEEIEGLKKRHKEIINANRDKAKVIDKLNNKIEYLLLTIQKQNITLPEGQALYEIKEIEELFKRHKAIINANRDKENIITKLKQEIKDLKLAAKNIIPEGKGLYDIAAIEDLERRHKEIIAANRDKGNQLISFNKKIENLMTTIKSSNIFIPEGQTICSIGEIEALNHRIKELLDSNREKAVAIKKLNDKVARLLKKSKTVPRGYTLLTNEEMSEYKKTIAEINYKNAEKDADIEKLFNKLQLLKEKTKNMIELKEDQSVYNNIEIEELKHRITETNTALKQKNTLIEKLNKKIDNLILDTKKMVAIPEGQALYIVEEIEGLNKRHKEVINANRDKRNLLAKLNTDMENMLTDVMRIKNSVAWRLGLTLTWPFRMIAGFFRSLKANGLKYTMKRVQIKLSRNNPKSNPLLIGDNNDKSKNRLL